MKSYSKNTISKCDPVFHPECSLWSHIQVTLIVVELLLDLAQSAQPSLHCLWLKQSYSQAEEPKPRLSAQAPLCVGSYLYSFREDPYSYLLYQNILSSVFASGKHSFLCLFQQNIFSPVSASGKHSLTCLLKQDILLPVCSSKPSFDITGCQRTRSFHFSVCGPHIGGCGYILWMIDRLWLFNMDDWQAWALSSGQITGCGLLLWMTNTAVPLPLKWLIICRCVLWGIDRLRAFPMDD